MVIYNTTLKQGQFLLEFHGLNKNNLQLKRVGVCDCALI